MSQDDGAGQPLVADDGRIFSTVEVANVHEESHGVERTVHREDIGPGQPTLVDCLRRHRDPSGVSVRE